MQKPILLFGSRAKLGALMKAHVAGYTRSDGTFVGEHDDNRQAAQKPMADADALAEHHGKMSERHARLATIKGKNHPDHDTNLHASRLHAQAKYSLEQAKNADGDEERSQHMAAYNHVKDKIKSAESELGDDHMEGHGLTETARKK